MAGTGSPFWASVMSWYSLVGALIPAALSGGRPWWPRYAEIALSSVAVGRGYATT